MYCCRRIKYCPYVDNPALGRVCHVYVSKKYRRKGIATLLLKEIMKVAEGNFKEVRYIHLLQ